MWVHRLPYSGISVAVTWGGNVYGYIHIVYFASFGNNLSSNIQNGNSEQLYILYYHIILYYIISLIYYIILLYYYYIIIFRGF